MDNGTVVKIKWSDIGFIKLFNYNVGIFASDKARALIIPLKYWNQIAKFMEDSRIIVTFYRWSARQSTENLEKPYSKLHFSKKCTPEYGN